MRRPSIPAVLLAALVLLVACLPGQHAPNVPPGHTLELGGTPPPPPFSGAFGVVFAAPQGETRDPSEVTVVFNRPMRALEAVGTESAPPATLVVRGTTTSPRGGWRWLGTSALVFAPESRLPDATEYVVTVPAGTRSLSGEALAAPYEASFSTPRPHVERLDVTPEVATDALVPGSTFAARFNQAVEPREVERAASLMLGEGKAAHRVAFHASRPDPKNGKLVKIVPAAPLPLATPVSLVFDPSLRGAEGPLPMNEAHHFDMATYGPLTVARIYCWDQRPNRCRAGTAVSVELSNRVAYSEVRAHVRITPPVPVQWSKTRDDEKASDFTVPATLRAGTSYRVTVTAGMRDEHGQTLARDADIPVTVDDLEPSVVLGLNGTVLEAATIAGRAVPVTSVNTASYALASGPLDPREVADLVAPHEGSEKPEHLFARVSAWPGMHVEHVSPGGGRNVATAKMVPIAPLLAATGGRGAFFLATASDSRVASVTDLGITAKMSRFGSLVWVTRLSDGQPVPGATVSIAGRADTVFETRTDADGLAAIPADRYLPANDEGTMDEQHLVYARLGDDWTWKRVGDVFRSGSDGVWVDASGGLQPQGMLFTDRGVYRPGETVELEAIFRLPRPKGTETPGARAVTIGATDAQGETLFGGKATLDEFGVAAVHVPLPATAHLGEARLEAKLEGEKGEAAGVTVQLAAYKASEFKVGVDAGAPSWLRGVEGSFDVHGDYLFGAPMAGAKVRWNVTRARTWFTPPGADGFVVSDDAYEAELESRAPRAGKLQSGEGALDAHGVFAAKVPLALEGQHGTEVVTLEAEVEDVSRQTAAGRASGLVHPAAFYVALRRPKDWFVGKGDAVRADVAAVEPAGKHRAGVPVHVDLVRRTWTSVLESTGEYAGHWDSKPVDATLASCDVVTTADSAGCALAAAEPGYYLVRARARDEKGREAVASYDVYVIGEGGDAGWATSDASEVRLVPDKKAYEVGDVARVLVKSPFREADALVTVERSGIYRQERVHLVGATPTLKVPITEDLRPNAFVSVHLVRGRTKAAPARGADVGAPAYKSGYAALSIDPESRRLKVALTPAKKELRPGDTVEADVAVTDVAGRPVAGELTLWAVDEGVLMLTGYATPDPIPTFTAPRSLAVFAMESRADLARIFRASFGQLGVDKGDEGGGGGTMRADFRATAWFQPAVKTGADGRAHVRFKLPDNLTTFRVMAVAVARDDRFGDGDAQVTTSRPLMLRPALPRFLRAGDAIDAGVVVTTKGMADSTVEVTASAEGVSVGGESKRVVTVKKGESVEVRWPITTPRVGPAKLTFRARAGGESDAVEVTKHVDAPATLETVALEGETTSVSAEKLGALGSLRDDVGGLDVRVSSTALVGVGDGMEQLLEYPYGCTEQLTSRLVPLVAARDLATAFGIALPKDPDGLADVAIAKVLANQRAEGGFGWWPDSVESDPWVTAYALWGLDAAKKEGRPVPQAAIDHAVQWLRGNLSKLEAARSVDLARRAFVVDVLATIGQPDPGFTSRLYDRRSEMPLFARALLAHAIAVGKMDPAEGQELLRDLEQHLRVTPESATVAENLGDDYAALLDSEARTTALVLRALVALDPRHALAPRLARGLLGERRGGRWASTHDAAWSLLALDDYRRAFEKQAPSFDARVWVADELALDAPFRDKSPLQRGATVSMAKVLAKPEPAVAFQVDGPGTLFYEARLRYARRDAPHDDLDRGFFVRKLLRAVTPDGLRDALGTLPAETRTSVRAGDLVLVDLVLVTPVPREQVVLDDPMAAGLEPVDASLATTARSLDVSESGGEGEQADEEQTDDDARASGRGWGEAWFHREMRDDRVLTFVEHMPAGAYHYRYLARATTVGKFQVPPTKAECMYDPGVFGRNAASELEVKAP
ncbi:MAG: Ig-like domain-containing protein [Polyangiaceae bacterium]